MLSWKFDFQNKISEKLTVKKSLKRWHDSLYIELIHNFINVYFVCLWSSLRRWWFGVLWLNVWSAPIFLSACLNFVLFLFFCVGLCLFLCAVCYCYFCGYAWCVCEINACERECRTERKKFLESERFRGISISRRSITVPNQPRQSPFLFWFWLDGWGEGDLGLFF